MELFSGRAYVGSKLDTAGMLAGVGLLLDRYRRIVVMLSEPPQPFDELTQRDVRQRLGRWWLFPVPLKPLFLHRGDAERGASIPFQAGRFRGSGRKSGQVDSQDRRRERVPSQSSQRVPQRPHVRQPLDGKSLVAVPLER